MMTIFRLLLQQWWRSRTWVLLLLLLVGGAVVAPALVPWQIDPDLAPFARAQVLYGLVFVIGAVVVPIATAEAGRAQISQNHRLFWRALGVGDQGHFGGLLLAIFGLAAFLALVGGAAIAWAGPRELSLVSVVQASVLTALGFSVGAPLVAGISQHLASAPAAILGILFNAVGYYGPASVNSARSVPTSAEVVPAAWEILFVLLPQLRLGDQAERITFAWPAIPWGAFALSCAYLVAWTFISTLIGYAFWRNRR